LRQEAIASNLANLETPHYQRLDVTPNFAAQLRGALINKSPQAIQSIQPELAKDPSAISSRRDGNSVQLESEMLHLNQNALDHAFETQLVSGYLSRLRLAITGRSR